MMNEDVKELYLQARTFFAQQNYEEALEYINKAIVLEKMDTELYIQKGIIFAAMGDLPSAVGEMKNALKVDRKCAEVYFHIGNLYALGNDLEHSIENYNAAISFGYNDPQLFYNMAMVYEEKKDWEMALRFYTKATLENPNKIDARIKKIKVLISTNQFEEAIKESDELMKVNYTVFEAYHFKAQAYVRLGMNEEALKVLDEAVEQFPNDSRLILDRANVMINEAKTESAMDDLNALMKRDDISLADKRMLCLTKARSYSESEDSFEDFISALEEAKRISKQMREDDIDPEATFLLATAYTAKQEFEKVKVFAEELIKDGTKEFVSSAYYMLPFSTMQLNGIDEARPIYKNSIAKLRTFTLSNPTSLDGYFFRALCLRDIDELDKALEVGEYLLKLDSKNENYIQLNADILDKKGEKEKADKLRAGLAK